MNLTKRQKSMISMVTLAMFIELIDGSALNTSLPQIASFFSVNTCDASLAITIYLFALGAFIPLSGFLVERFGEKNVIIFSFSLFTLGTVGCGYSDSINQLVLCRLLQGIGGSFMFPVGRLILAKEFNKDLIRVMSLVTSISLTGPIIGPVIGGYLTTFFGWQWIFFLNIPFLTIGIFLAYKYLPEKTDFSSKHFDFKGFLLLFIGFGLVIFSARSEINNYPLIYRLLSIISGLIAIYLYILYAKKTQSALIDLKVFHNRIFKHLTIGSFLLRFSNGILVFIIPILFFEKHKFSSFSIGLMMLSFVIGAWIIKPFLTHITRKDSNKTFLMFNSFFLACTQLFFVAFIDVFNLFMFIFYGILVGILNSVQIAFMNTFMFLSLPNKDKAQGNAIYLALSHLGGCLGITISAIFLTSLNSSYTASLPYYFLTYLISITTLFSFFLFKRATFADLTIPSST